VRRALFALGVFALATSTSRLPKALARKRSTNPT
jgi:hypothetical protein